MKKGPDFPGLFLIVSAIQDYEIQASASAFDRKISMLVCPFGIRPTAANNFPSNKSPSLPTTMATLAAPLLSSVSVIIFAMVSNDSIVTSICVTWVKSERVGQPIGKSGSFLNSMTQATSSSSVKRAVAVITARFASVSMT